MRPFPVAANEYNGLAVIAKRAGQKSLTKLKQPRMCWTPSTVVAGARFVREDIRSESRAMPPALMISPKNFSEVAPNEHLSKRSLTLDARSVWRVRSYSSSRSSIEFAPPNMSSKKEKTAEEVELESYSGRVERMRRNWTAI